MPQASHNPCKFVAALRIQGITPAFGHDFPVYNALFDPYENARTAGICGAERGRSRPLSFLLLLVVTSSISLISAQKGENSLIPLLLLSPAKPLRWVLPGAP